MLSIEIINAPINGCEGAGKVSEPIAALTQFYRALNNRDLMQMAESQLLTRPAFGTIRSVPTRPGCKHLS
jgi:hypothetical protein